MDDINMNRICFNCKKILKKSESSHIKKCVQHMNYVDGRYNQLIHDFKELDLSYNNIIDLYHNKEYSLISFKSEFGLAYKQTNFLLEYYNIEKKSKEKLKKEKSKKYNSTCIINHGFIGYNNVEKRKETCVKKYGCDNIFKNVDFIESSIIKKKNKYGKAGLGWINETTLTKKERINSLHDSLKKWWINMSISEKNARIEIIKDARFKWWNELSEIDKYKFISNLKNRYDSKLEVRISSILTLNKIEHKSQHWVNKMSYDIKIGNILLEINGDFWHCNPDIYPDNYLHPYIKKTSKEIREKDLLKKYNAEKYGYKVYYIWEKFMAKSNDTILYKYISEILKIN